jgi:NAD-dependent deacetylase
MNKLYSLITQNIDNLHQKAGNDPKKIIELHGNAFKVRCLSCGFLYDRDEIEERLDKGEEVPYCTKCKGILKPATISFGQAMPEKETREAFRRASECELLIVLGSSLVVYPAASIPLEAVACGAKLGIINLTPTPYDGYAEVVIRGRCGEVMKEVMRQVKQMS